MAKTISNKRPIKAVSSILEWEEEIAEEYPERKGPTTPSGIVSEQSEGKLKDDGVPDDE